MSIIINFDINCNNILNNYFKTINKDYLKYYINNDSIIHINLLHNQELYYYFIEMVHDATKIINNSGYIRRINNNGLYELLEIFESKYEWNFCIYDNMIFNLPFTLDKVIFLPLRYIKDSYKSKNNRNFICTLVHEKMHIYQRKNINTWINYVNKLDNNWIIINENNKIYNLLNDQKILEKFNLPIIINPDTTYNFKYVYKKDNNYYYGVFILDNNNLKKVWLRIDLNNHKLIRVDEDIQEQEHPFELYVYKFSDLLVKVN